MDRLRNSGFVQKILYFAFNRKADRMRVLVSGGGTAGHINPALAIADKIKSENRGAVVEYVGTPDSMESRLVPNAGYAFHAVKVRGFKRALSLANVDAAVKAVTSVSHAKKIIREFQPDIVIGTGGYVSWPVVKAASRMGVPTMIHEQNAVPGVTTKMLSKYADRVLISFESSRELFDCDPNKLVLTGNPVSEKMLKAGKEEMRTLLGIPDNAIVVLSAGGSLGAARVNEAVFELIKTYSSSESDLRHFHATGRGGYEEQAELYREIGFHDMDSETLQRNGVTVKRYIYNMPELLAAADIVIGRAGAMTLSEIAALGKAAIVIPSPNVTNNHQYKNAKVLADGNAAILIEEKDLTGTLLAEKVKDLAENATHRHTLEKNIRGFAVYGTLERIYEMVVELSAHPEKTR